VPICGLAKHATAAKRLSPNVNPIVLGFMLSVEPRFGLGVKRRCWPVVVQFEIGNGFSKKVENLEAAVALHYMHYNFCRIHQTLRVTPAMEAGVSDHVWSLDEVIALL